VLCCDVLWRVVLCCVVLCRVVLCCVVLCCVVLCCVVLCCVRCLVRPFCSSACHATPLAPHSTRRQRSGNTRPRPPPLKQTFNESGLPVSVWTSTLRRTIATANFLPYPKLRWKALDEIHAVRARARVCVCVCVCVCACVLCVCV
jgi:hypothetical protein